MADFSTNVPQPTFGDSGVVLPTEDQILAGVQQDINAALGGGIDPALTTPQGQIATTETAVVGDSQALFAWYVNQVDPATSSGRMQDALGRIYFLTRIAASPTVQPCICSGLDNVTIPIGTLAQDDLGNLWVCEAAGVINNGSVLLNFQSTATGPILGPTSLRPFSFVAGWESITPSGGAVLGTDVESRAAFEARRQATVAANSVGMVDSILGSLLEVDNVLDAYVIDNPNSIATTIGGVVVNQNSIFACVVGGNATDVAMAIWLKKAPGCGYTGTTTVVVNDPDPRYVQPLPTYDVSFTFATAVNFAVLVTLKNSALVPNSALTQIQQAIISAFAGLDGGTRAKIGSLVLASRYYADVLGLGSWVEIVSIKIGVLGTAASFTASIGGNVMNVSVVASGTLAVGQLVLDATGLIMPGTTITGLGTGTGGTGTYTVSVVQTVASEAMTATNLGDDVQMDIDQVPVVSASGIGLALT